MQSLHGGVAPPSYRTALLPVGAVKRCHEWRGSSALEKSIKAPPIQIIAFSLFVVSGIAGGEAHRLPDVGWLVGAHATPSDSGDHEAAEVQGLITNDLGVQTVAGAPCQKAIFGVLFL